MEIKAYALVKNEVVIGKFFDTKRSVEETYAKKLEDSQYSIGVFTFAGETEIIDESDMIELYTSKSGYMQWQRGWEFYADDVNDRYDEKYREGDYIFKVKKEHAQQRMWGGYKIRDSANVDVIKPYKKPKPVEEVKEETTEDVEMSQLKEQLNQAIEDMTTNERHRQIGRYIDAIPDLPNLRPILRERTAIITEPTRVEEMREAPEGIVVRPSPYVFRPLTSMWLNNPNANVMNTSDEADKIPPLKLTQEDLDCPF